MDLSYIKKKIYIGPGSICLPNEPTLLYTVIGSGIVTTIFDSQNGYGGMNYYLRPIRQSTESSNPIYACPAIIGLLNMFLEYGAKLENLEAHIYGGAINPEIEGYIKGMAEDNVKVGIEILQKSKVRVINKDTGGDMGRKIAFNTLSGEVVIAKVPQIRASDWYPAVEVKNFYIT